MKFGVTFDGSCRQIYHPTASDPECETVRCVLAEEELGSESVLFGRKHRLEKPDVVTLIAALQYWVDYGRLPDAATAIDKAAKSTENTDVTVYGDDG